jgi:hypothetical protein
MIRGIGSADGYYSSAVQEDSLVGVGLVPGHVPNFRPRLVVGRCKQLRSAKLLLSTALWEHYPLVLVRGLQTGHAIAEGEKETFKIMGTT